MGLIQLNYPTNFLLLHEERQLNPDVQTHYSCPYTYNTYNVHTHTHAHTVKPLPIKAVRLLLQSVTPLLICQVLVETHICEYFTSALSASQ